MLDEFDRVQALVRSAGAYVKRDFAYAGLMRCALCGRAVVGELQRGRHRRGGWIYYRCGNGGCPTARRSVREDRLDAQIEADLRRLTWPPEVKRIVADELRAWLKEEAGELWQLQQGQEKDSRDLERKAAVLLEMRLAGEIDAETYRRKDAELRQRTGALKGNRASNRERVRETLATIDRLTDFAVFAHATFRLGSAAQKRQIAEALGAKYLMDGGRVTIEYNPLLPPFQRVAAPGDAVRPGEAVFLPPAGQSGQSAAGRSEAGLQPLKVGSRKAKGTAFCNAIPHGWAEGTGLQTFRTPDVPRGVYGLPNAGNRLRAGTGPIRDRRRCNAARETHSREVTDKTGPSYPPAPVGAHGMPGAARP
jgi:hypothetical protein